MAVLIGAGCSDNAGSVKKNADTSSEELFLTKFLSFNDRFSISVEGGYKIDGKMVGIDFVRQSEEKECAELVRFLKGLKQVAVVAEVDSNTELSPGTASTMTITFESKGESRQLSIFGDDTVVRREKVKSIVFRIQNPNAQPLIFQVLSICGLKEGEKTVLEEKDDSDPFGAVGA